MRVSNPRRSRTWAAVVIPVAVRQHAILDPDGRATLRAEDRADQRQPAVAHGQGAVLVGLDLVGSSPGHASGRHAALLALDEGSAAAAAERTAVSSGPGVPSGAQPRMST